MHIHILGICGTFMAGIAAIARAAGHRVTGSDRSAWPPMSDQLAAMGVDIIEGFDPAQLDLQPDLIVVGNVMSRGMPIVEAILDRRLAYCSGPEWLARGVLKDRHVIAVSGTHGKTSTTSLVAWILDQAGLEPGFLVGGVPGGFSESARLGKAPFFVIEADEYDTAFFDKRAKFLHYCPTTLIVNNLEFDHADIYPDMDAILWQFHQMLRVLPGRGRLIANGADKHVTQLINMGCWTPVETFSADAAAAADWCPQRRADGSLELVARDGQRFSGPHALSGRHGLENAAAAVLAARQAGVSIADALRAVASFPGVKRRLELVGEYAGISLYDDFAHHPTAIRTTIEGLREQLPAGRILALFEPRSNSMKLGAHRDGLAAALACADRALVLKTPEIKWNLPDALLECVTATVLDSVPAMAAEVLAWARPGDAIVLMSNGDFGGLQDLLSKAFKQRQATVDRTV